MPLPVNVDHVTFHGKYVLLDGEAAVGTVQFTPTVTGPLVNAAEKTFIVPVKLTATLDENGEFTITVPATDDPDNAPAGWSYTVRENINNTSRSYVIVAPVASAGQTIEFADLEEALP